MVFSSKLVSANIEKTYSIMGSSSRIMYDDDDLPIYHIVKEKRHIEFPYHGYAVVNV